MSNCDIVFSSNASKTGIIASPSFPNAYAPKTYCRFEFRGSARERIQLNFKDFTLPSEGDGDDCLQSDTLHVCVDLIEVPVAELVYAVFQIQIYICLMFFADTDAQQGSL